MTNFSDQFVDQKNQVLKNKLGITDASRLQSEEASLVSSQAIQIRAGNGPARTFDREHLKALHKQLFGDVYEWAGHMRDERPIINGEQLDPYEIMSKGANEFTRASRIESALPKALASIQDIEALRNGSREEFIERAGEALAKLNTVHPFREGNGRTQRLFIQELGNETGHKVSFRGITQERNIRDSIESGTSGKPDAIQHLLRDATEPDRIKELVFIKDQLNRHTDRDPEEIYIRTARDGEKIAGTEIYRNETAGHILSKGSIVLVDARDLPERKAENRDLSLTATKNFGEADASDLLDRFRKEARAPDRSKPKESGRER